MQAVFDKSELVIPAAFPRITRMSTRTPDEHLEICANFYTAKTDVSVKQVSVLLCPANGFAKVSLRGLGLGFRSSSTEY